MCFIYFIPSIKQWFEIEQLRDMASSSVGSVPKEDKIVETPVNFIELKKENPDIYAWINIPGTVIDYPILQRPDDNTYYLTRSVYGETQKYGSIYTENYNNTDFNDFNTLIYGHNMKNGTMFGSLKKYKDQVFFNENQYINIYMPGRILKYQIFSAYIWDNRHILLSFNFKDKDVRREYLDSVFSVRGISSHINNELNVDENDRIITLSTCTSSDDQRYLVQGVLVYDSQEQ